MDLLGLVLLVVLDTAVSWVRMFIALGISVVVSVTIGIWAATSKRAEKVILPIVDILQTLPILAFFPFVIIVFIAILGAGTVGINAAVIFLIVTSMIWNIILAVYESVKTIPKEFLEVAQLYHFDIWRKLRRVYIPACLPRVVEQSILSWSIGLFYLVTSEIFSTGATTYSVGYGIGGELLGLAQTGGLYYALGLGVFIAFVVMTRFFFFRPLERYSTRYMRQQTKTPRPRYERAMIEWVERKLPRNRVTFDRQGFLVDPIRSKRHIVRAAKPFGWDKVYKLVIALVAISIIYVIATNATLLADELQVIPALFFSFIRVWLAFVVIVALAVPLCVYITFMTRRSSQYMLLFQIIASIPATVLLPAIAILLSNRGELVALVIFFLSGFWYVIFSIIASTRTLPSNIFEVQGVFGIRGKNAWKNIYLRAIVPGLITGAITGIAAEWNASIVAEYFTSTGIGGSVVVSSVTTGMGRLLDSTIAGSGNLPLLMIALLNLTVMILLVNTFVWKRFYNNIAKIYG